MNEQTEKQTQDNQATLVGELVLLNEAEVLIALPAKFSSVTGGIAELKTQYSGIKITSADDKENYELARLALSDLRSKRVAVESLRESLKRPFLEVGKAIDAEAKRITSELVEIENPVKAEKQRIDDEKKAAKEAEEKAHAEALQIEREKLQAAAREKAEAERAQAEAEKLAAEQKAAELELENQKLREAAAKAQAEQKAEADRVAAEQKAIQDAQAAELAKLKAEKAEADAQADKLRAEAVEAKAATEKAEADRVAAEKAEAKRIADEIEAAEKAEAERIAYEAKLKSDLEAREKLRAELASDFTRLKEANLLLVVLHDDICKLEHAASSSFKSELLLDISAIQTKIINWIGE